MKKKLVVLSIVTMLLMTFASNTAYATSGLELEISHEWATDGYSQAHSVASGDIDNDSVIEIVTVGYFQNSTTSNYEGELEIWSWNGTELILEHAEYFDFDSTLSTDTQFYSVALANVDDDAEIEIIITGYGYAFFIISISPPKFAYQEQGILIVGSWNGVSFERESFSRWPNDKDREAKFYGLAVSDVDKDDMAEIVTVGYVNETGSGSGSNFHGVITIWHLESDTLVLETSYGRMISGDTTWRAVSVSDVDNDENSEIVVVGDFYDKNLKQQCAMLRIGTWDGVSLEWETSMEWFTYSNTYVHDVAIGDLNSDGTIEIVTCGYQQSANTFNTQLRIWTWNQEILTLKLSVEGGVVDFASTFSNAVAIADIDGDGKNEILLGLEISLLLWSGAHMRIFEWNGDTLITEDYSDWEGVSSIQAIVADDVDSDGTVEIVTTGYASGLFISPSSFLGIWNVSKVASVITVTINPASIVIGNQVTISGMVTNETGATPISNAEVMIEYSRDPLPVFIHLATIKTNENGEYTYLWIPPDAGQYTVRVSWKGDYGHEDASNTATFAVEKASSMITLTLSSYTAKNGDSISVSGTLYPAKSAPITLMFTMPNGTITTKTVNSNTAGVFSDTFTVNQIGTWTVKASWTGDEQYKSATSASTIVTAQPVDQWTPMFAMGGLGLGIIALILAIVGIYMASKKKTLSPAPTPPAPPAPPSQ